MIRYEADPALSFDRQRALERAYSDTKVFALVQRGRRDGRYLARSMAANCRALIAAFGVRRERRREIAVREIADILADTQAMRPEARS